MSDKLEQAGAEDFIKRQAIPDEDDVEGHSIVRRDADGFSNRRDLEGEGLQRRSAIPDDDDDVEGHQMHRGDDGAVLRRDAEDGFSRKVGPGEGFTTRS